MRGFVHGLEDGVDVTMWQMNRSEEKDSPAEFALKASHVTVKIQKKGELWVQGVVNFTLRGGYLSKAIGRGRGGKSSLRLWRTLVVKTLILLWSVTLPTVFLNELLY
jgi:hypothetical protein